MRARGRRIIPSIRRYLSTESAAALDPGPDDHDDEVAVFTKLLKSCTGQRDLVRGRSIHDQIRRSNRSRKRCLANSIMEMYGRCGSAIEAKEVFDQLGLRTNRCSWAILIAAYAQNRQIEEAELLYQMFPLRDRRSSTAMISGYARAGQIEKARAIFDGLTQRDFVLWNVMLKGYAFLGDLEESTLFFSRMVSRDCASWTTMLTVYAKRGHFDSAKMLFDAMPQRDEIAWNAMIMGFAANGSLDEAKCLFNLMPLLETLTWTSLLAPFAQVGHLDEARRVFDSMPERDSASWKAMLVACSLGGNIQECKHFLDKFPMLDTSACSMMISTGNVEDGESIFFSMEEKDSIAWSAMLCGYARGGDIPKAKALFDRMPTRDVFSWTGILAAYSQGGDVDAAVVAFDRMPMTDVVAWNALIVGFGGSGKILESRDLFEKIPARNLLTWNSLLQAYSSASAKCRRVYDKMPQHDATSRVLAATSYSGTSVEILHRKLEMLENLPEGHVAALNTKVAAYAKAGQLRDAWETFDSICPCGVVSYNAMLAAYTLNGHLSAGLNLFHAMNLQGVSPNDVTFMAILIGCRHKGLLEEGRDYFVSMLGDFNLNPGIEHYYAMVDMLARAKQLWRAESLINSMPYLPDTFAWTNLLGACTTLGDLERANRTTANAVKLDPGVSTPYVLLSNVYAQDS
ncbi:pentatricopeptide repeat-containing protein At4g02750-like [Selaginella moellendorffii]|uniref:pentatricopeptide repeat-containing protein At4g02750-like n=1 Tax=Selaginella moellendorffii TaxID=88036 RepID=UPI000D1CF5ED|nr:pentatricopeptide repeat-containing protein At4g02750-like [Selaginella moellendorffii]|eukprot:XP_024542427.1 pentatricopeptide repeat-containing protein At4g02750-like [Selaginella moellendorffii]